MYALRSSVSLAASISPTQVVKASRAEELNPCVESRRATSPSITSRTSRSSRAAGPERSTTVLVPWEFVSISPSPSRVRSAARRGVRLTPSNLARSSCGTEVPGASRPSKISVRSWSAASSGSWDGRRTAQPPAIEAVDSAWSVPWWAIGRLKRFVLQKLRILDPGHGRRQVAAASEVGGSKLMFDQRVCPQSLDPRDQLRATRASLGVAWRPPCLHLEMMAVSHE